MNSKKQNKYYIILLFFLISFSNASTKTNILIINSNDVLSLNNNEFNKGLRDKLMTFNSEYKVYSLYLNDNIKIANSYESFRKKYENISFKIVFIKDKKALNFYKMYSSSLFKNTQTVISNVKNDLIDETNSIYIKNENSFDKITRFIKNNHKNINNIYLLNDNSKKSQNNILRFKKDINENNYDFRFIFSEFKNLNDLKKEIKNLDDNTLILIDELNYINKKEIISKDMLFKELFKNKIVYTTSYDIKFNKYIIASLFYDSGLLGNTYALLINSILKGNHLDKNVLTYDLRSFAFNEKKLNQYNILKDNLANNVIYYNKYSKTSSDSKKDEFMIFIIFIFYFISFILIIMLFLKLKKSNKENKDITSKNNLIQENKKNIISLTDNLPGLVYRSNKDELNDFEYLSKGAFELTGYTKDQLINKEVLYHDLIITSDKKMHDEKIKHALSTYCNYYIKYEIKTQNEKSKTVFEIGRGIYNSSKELIAKEGYISDISELTQAQNKILIMNANLEHTVFERTVELEESNKELQRLINDLKNTHEQLLQSEKMASLGSLVAGVSHEINTPVGLALLGATHFLEITDEINKAYENDRLEEKDFQEYIKTSKELASTINFSLVKAVDLIQSFKQIAVDQSSDSIRTFAMYKYLEEILLSIENKTKKMNHNIFIMCDEDIVIKSYPGAISQIITNLVMNSIIHAFEPSEEGSIVIKVELSAKRIFLTYSDNGKGIEKENIDKVFDPFFTTRRDEGGSGLGLNIVYNVVTSKLKGKIECNSLRNIGTEFKITFNVE